MALLPFLQQAEDAELFGPERFGSYIFRSQMMRKDVGVVEAETISLEPRVAAELMKISRTITLMRWPPHKSRSQSIGPTQGMSHELLRSRSHITFTYLMLRDTTS